MFYAPQARKILGFYGLNMIEPIGVCQGFPDFCQISENDIWQSSTELRARIAIKNYFWGL